MIIEIGKFRVVSDARQFQLLEITGVNPKTGEDYFRRHGYFMSMSELLKKLFKLQISGDDINSIAALNNAVNAFIIQVSQAVSK